MEQTNGFVIYNTWMEKILNQFWVIITEENHDSIGNLQVRWCLANNLFCLNLGYWAFRMRITSYRITCGEGEDIPHRYLSNLDRTIFDELKKNSIPWKIYVDDYNPALNQTERRTKER